MEILYQIKLEINYSIKTKKRPQANFRNRSIRNPSKEDEETLYRDIRKQLNEDDMKFLKSIRNDETIAIEANVENYYKARRKMDIGKPRLATPDCDNFLKLALDSVNGVLWKDDRQIFKATTEKYYDDHSHAVIIFTYYKF